MLALVLISFSTLKNKNKRNKTQVRLQHGCVERANTYLDLLNQDCFFTQEECRGLEASDLPYVEHLGK